MHVQYNDVALMALLGSVMKSANNLNQFVNKERHVAKGLISSPIMLVYKRSLKEYNDFFPFSKGTYLVH